MIPRRGLRFGLDNLLLVAAAVLAIGAVVMLLDLNKELASSQSIFKYDLPSFSVRAEYDLSMLVSEINEFIQNEPNIDQVLERYEVLIARLSHYETAFLAEYAEPNRKLQEIIERTKSKTLSLEGPFYALQVGEEENARILRGELKGMRASLAELTKLTRQHQLLQYQIIDGSLAHSARVGILMLASTLILGGLTVGRFWYSLQEKTRFTQDLEAKIQARTRDLQLSNNELKREIIERQRAEENLAERDQQMHRVQKMQAVGRITAGVAHDFNNLLAVIMGNIELLMMTGDEQKSRKYLDNALSATVMGSQLTRKLLAFGRRSQLKPEVLNLNHIVNELDDLFLQTITVKNRLETRLAEDLQLISVDRSLLENVLLNLIINARDALNDSGVITLETDNARLETSHSEDDGRLLPPGDYVQLTISDSGSGMSAEVLEQAIEPFFTTKSESEGSGLGLSMAYGFVQQSNGQLRVTSELGRGTSVKLVFPVCSVVDAADKVPQSAAYKSAGHKRRILVAEDSAAVRNTVVAQLRLLGCDPVEASSGNEAYQVIQADKSIELLITDVVMPGSLQGPELALNVMKINPELRIVFMSGYPKGMDQSTDSPTSQFTKLMKPISLAMLSQTLREEFG